MRSLVVCVALVLAAASGREAGRQEAPPGPPPGPPRSFGEHPAWDDGKAELSVYDAEEIVEGEKRRFEALAIVVAEHLDPAQMVKREEFDLSYFPVLKCNWVLSIPTGVYRYQQMASLHLRRSDLLALKAVFSSQEWCGTSFAEWRRDRPTFETRSYFDGEGDRSTEFAIPAENVLFHEQVPLWIRGRRPDVARTEQITLIRKRLASARCPPPELVPAQIVFDGAKEADGVRRFEVRLVVDGAHDTFLLGPDFPHSLLEWRRADGTVWKLVKTTRLDYWHYSKNEFAGMRY